jgi:hypothetical protein
MSITLSDEEQRRLHHLVRSPGVKSGLARRARIVLLLVAGVPILQIALRVGLQRRLVYEWLRRFQGDRIDGLYDRPRPGRAPGFSPCAHHGSDQTRLRDAQEA